MTASFVTNLPSFEFGGPWKWGVDFADSRHVIAVRLGDGEIKYGLSWIGPLDTSTADVRAKLARWAESALMAEGGYVHLFPADGDAVEELDEWIEAEEET